MKKHLAALLGTLPTLCAAVPPLSLALSLFTASPLHAWPMPSRTPQSETTTAEAPPAKPLTSDSAPPASAAAPEAATTKIAVPRNPFDPENRKLLLVRYGLQFSHESADFAQTKIGSIAFLDALSNRWVYQVEFGGWADKGAGGPKRLSGSLYLSASIGVEVVMESVFARILVGPTLISNTDDRLSTNFQIHHEFSLGVRGKNGLGIGAFLKHFSNGGIKLPNESRDIFGFLVQFAI